MTPWEIHYFFWALIFIVQGLLPIAGILLFISEIEIETGVLEFIKTIVPVSGIFYFLLGENASPSYPCHNIYLFYSLIIPVFLHFLQFRNPDKTTKVLGVFLMISFLFCQYWEIPVFIAGHLGILGYEYLGSIDQLYLILVFYLSIKLAKISIDKETLLHLFIPLVFSSIIMYLVPVTPGSMPLWFLVRGVSCFFLGKVFVDRSIL